MSGGTQLVLGMHVRESAEWRSSMANGQAYTEQEALNRSQGTRDRVRDGSKRNNGPGGDAASDAASRVHQATEQWRLHHGFTPVV